ncbi:MAG: hypothetical protein PHR26_03275 [Candidatus ainarchaeum sp.]|nr:hypothetical protein [Candidatus ainarchaeum sp.]MDD3976183.1 hypothetical protein [Candidatus ainarchaeum sp.]
MPVFKRKNLFGKPIEKLDVVNKVINVSRISFKKDKNNTLIKLGSGKIGDVYLGTVYFKYGTKRQVAIKKYKYDISKDIPLYNKIISDLSSIKLPKDPKYPNRKETTLLPKMCFLKIKNKSGVEECVQITPAYIKNGKSKFLSNNEFLGFNEKEMVWILSEIAKKGYDPYDLVAQFKNNESLIPIDLDILVETYKHKGLLKGEEKINNLLYSLAKVSEIGLFGGFGDLYTYNKMCDILIQMNPSYKKIINKNRKSVFNKNKEDLINSSF